MMDELLQQAIEQARVLDPGPSGSLKPANTDQWVIFHLPDGSYGVASINPTGNRLKIQGAGANNKPRLFDVVYLKLPKGRSRKVSVKDMGSQDIIFKR